MQRLLFAVLLAAACGGTSHPPVGPKNEGGTPRTLGPPPSIAWATDGQMGSFTATGMPAVSFDGSRVLIAVQVQGAGLTPPNLTLRELDRQSREAAHQDVLPYDTSEPDDAQPKPGAVDAANAFLASSNQQLGWTAMTATQSEEVLGPPDPNDKSDPDSPTYTGKKRVAVGAVEIVFGEDSHLTVRDGGKVVLDRDEPDWLAPPQHIDPSLPCGNPAYLEQAYVDGAHHLALVVIAYKGTDSCWEPSPESHVVAW